MVQLHTVCLRAQNIDDVLGFYSALFGCEPVKLPGLTGYKFIFPGEQLILQAEIVAFPQLQACIYLITSTILNIKESRTCVSGSQALLQQ